MLDFIERFWGAIALFLVTVVWGGRMTQRVHTLEKDDYMKKSECVERRSACQAHQRSEFNHGESEFGRLRQSIEDLGKEQQDRHDCVMKILLSMKKN